MSEWQTENLRGAINIGAQTIKSLELINGGAVIAVLTFYGNVLSSSPGEIDIDRSWLTPALLNFASGVAWAVLCSILAYLSQLFSATKPAWSRTEQVLRGGAVLAGLVSAGLFVLGVYGCAMAFG